MFLYQIGGYNFLLYFGEGEFLTLVWLMVKVKGEGEILYSFLAASKPNG